MTTVHYLLSGFGVLALATLAPAQSVGSAKPATTKRPAIGRVIDVLGDPIPAAEVQVIVDGKVVRKAFTDGEGVYLIPNMPKGGGHLRLGANGKTWTQLPWQGPRTPTVRNATLLDAGRIHGRVTDTEGQPVVGIDVVAVCRKDSQRTQTDATGDYVLDGVPVGNLTVNVWGDERPIQVSVHVRTDTECNLRIAATKANRRQVRVRGLPGTFAGAFVSVVNANLILMPDGGRFPLAPDGTATVVVNEMALVSPMIDGFSMSPTGRFAAAGNTTLEFEAKPANAHPNLTEVFGTVRTGIGRAVSGQRLFFYDHGSKLLGTTKVDRKGNFRAGVVTSSTGEYRVGMPLDKWALLDDRRTLRDGFTWVTAYSTDAIDLLVQETGDLNCPVQDDSGTLLALADITIANPSDPGTVMLASACDRSGQFQMTLPAETYEILAVTHDGIVCYGAVPIHQGGKNDKVRWRTIPTGTASGKVVDGTGKPMPGVELFFAARELITPDEVRAASRQKVRITTDRHGNFRCRGLPRGEWTVVALNHPEFATTELQVEAGKNLNLRIEPAN